MSFTATQYLFKASTFTATTTATQGSTTATAANGYVVPAATRFSVIAFTLTNTSTANQTTYADIALFDGTTSWPLVAKIPLYPGGAQIIEGAQKHILPTGGSMYVTPYATIVTAIMTGVEVT